MTEKELQDAVVDCAHRFHWRVAHFTRARQGDRHFTPVAYDGKGFPDLVLARHGEVIFAELKSPRGVLSRDQADWVDAIWPKGSGTATHRVFVFTPADWDAGVIEAALR